MTKNSELGSRVGSTVEAPVVHPLDAVVWQDALLQSYRNFQLLLQSIFVAVGVGLTVVVLSFKEATQLWVAAILLWVVGAVALIILFRLRRVIRARGEDVYYWQKEIIRREYEADLPRFFTDFKVTQILRQERGLPDSWIPLVNVPSLPKEDVDRLVEDSDIGMRRVVERTIVWSVVALWLVFASVSVVLLYLRTT